MYIQITFIHIPQDIKDSSLQIWRIAEGFESNTVKAIFTGKLQSNSNLSAH